MLIPIAFAGVFGISLILIAQTSGISMPLGLQRTMSYLPAAWDDEITDSTNNIFRETLNRLAVEKIREEPVFGSGLTFTFEEFFIMENPEYLSLIMEPDDDPQAYTFALGRSWHSTWVGHAATIGVFGSILWVFVQMTVLVQSWRIGHKSDTPYWCMVMCAFIFYNMCYYILTSWTSGGLAVTTMQGAVLLGLLGGVSKFKENMPESEQEDLILT